MRDPRMNLRALLEPRSVAVIGASDHPGVGRRVIHNLRQIGFEGEIIPINPRHEHVSGLRCFASLTDAMRAGKQMDAAAILLGRDHVVEVLEEAVHTGVQGVWALASGFAESGDGGRLLQNQAAAICRSHGIALCGPNCIGYLNPVFGSAAYSAPISPTLRPGSIGVVSQSGSVCMALANSDRGLGFRLLVSSGNEAVIDSSDYMEFLLRDPGTDVILALIEELRRPQRFLEVAKLGQRLRKPIVVLKLGRSSLARRTVLTHTGALAGTDAIYDAVFRKYGVLRVADLDEMLETASAFVGLKGNLPGGNRVGMLSLSGGEIGLMGDLSSDLNLSFPEWSNASRVAFAGVLPDYAELANPLDAWGSGDVARTYPVCIDAAAKDDVDLIVVSQDAPRGLANEQVEEASTIARAAGKTRQESGLPVVAISHLSGGVNEELQKTFTEGGIPLLQGTRAGLQAVHHLIEFAGTRKMEDRPVIPRRARRGSSCFPENGGVLGHDSARRLLKEYGIPSPRESLVASWQEAARVAELIGYPVMVSAVPARLPSESGRTPIAVSAADEAGLRSAYRNVIAGARAVDPDLESEEVLVQEMMQGAVAEVFLGLASDPAFGPVVLLGLRSGIGELLEETVMGIPPLTRDEVGKMLERIQAGRALKGGPGTDCGDMEALADAVLKMGHLGADWGDRLRSVDVSPLAVLPKGSGVMASGLRIEAAIDLWMAWDMEDETKTREGKQDQREAPIGASCEAAAMGRKVAR